MIAKKIEQGLEFLISKFSQNPKPLEWAIKPVTSIISTTEKKEINPNQFEAKLVMADKINYGSWLGNLNLNLNKETNKIEGAGNDQLGSSKWVGEKNESGYFFIKTYTSNPLLLASEENIFFALKKSPNNNFFDGHYYYLHNDNLDIENAQKIAENLNNNPQFDQLTIGGRCSMVINNTLTSEELRTFEETRIKSFPPIIDSSPQNILKYAEEVRRKITYHQGGEERILDSKCSNFHIFVEDPKTGRGIFTSMLNINLFDAFLLAMKDHHDILKRRGQLIDTIPQVPNIIYSSKSYEELSKKLV